MTNLSLLLPNDIPSPLPWLTQSFPAGSWRCVQVTLIDKIEVGAGACAAAAGDFLDGHVGVAEQEVGGLKNPAVAEFLISHARQEEDEAVEVGGAGIVAVTEGGDVGMTTMQGLQVGVENVGARRRKAPLDGRITRAAHVVGCERMGEGCNEELF